MPTMASTVRIWIFNAARLNDLDTLHKVSMLLKAVPAVASYVEKLYVLDTHHTSISVVTTLPTSWVRVSRTYSRLRSSALPMCGVVTERFSTCRFFLVSLSCNRGLKHMHLEGVAFPSFTDFARTLHSAPHSTTFAYWYNGPHHD